MSTAMLPRIGSTGFAAQDFAKPPDPSSIPFTMPPVSPGMSVLYYPNCNSSLPPVPANVISVESRRIFLSSQANGQPITDAGVRHAGDPLTMKDVERKVGCWDYTPRDKEIASLIHAVQHLQKCVVTMADSMGIDLPPAEKPGRVDFSMPGAEKAPPDKRSREEVQAAQAELDAALDQEIEELSTDNEPLPPGERVRMSR